MVTWGLQSIADSLVLELTAVQHIQANSAAFAAILQDGSVVTWGDDARGGRSVEVQRQLKRVQHVQATVSAFAAILDGGCVVTWGFGRHGGDSSAVQEQLVMVRTYTRLIPCLCCFA